MSIRSLAIRGEIPVSSRELTATGFSFGDRSFEGSSPWRNIMIVHMNAQDPAGPFPSAAFQLPSQKKFNKRDIAIRGFEKARPAREPEPEVDGRSGPGAASDSDRCDAVAARRGAVTRKAGTIRVGWLGTLGRAAAPARHKRPYGRLTRMTPGQPSESLPRTAPQPRGRRWRTRRSRGDGPSLRPFSATRGKLRHPRGLGDLRVHDLY